MYLRIFENFESDSFILNGTLPIGPSLAEVLSLMLHGKI